MFKKILINLSLATPSSLGLTFDDDMKFYENGDYKMALSIFSDLSYKGDAKATYGLGLMHYDGKGT
ncbi:hypothetical protein [Aliarcobacter cryaerophilus]|uniref:hypothetical protein n=1 Tax=Aliarcobacter cryaerophilus TaxID=28198 RepID=UPI0011DF7408|nr:hypothetical protein [Aliarcobacter cryaerophilus]